MDEIDKYLIKGYKESSNKIKSGEEYTLYMAYCIKCNEYKRIFSNTVAAPGGTLSCPICKARKEFPGLSCSWGRVKLKAFTIILPEEINIVGSAEGID